MRLFFPETDGAVPRHGARRKAVRAVLAAAAAAIDLAVGGCGRESPKPAPEALPVTLVKPEAAETAASWRMIGEVRPIREVALVARVSGFLVERKFIDGQTVPAGKVLYRIEERPYQIDGAAKRAALDRARAEAENAALEFGRAAKLFAENAADRHR